MAAMERCKEGKKLIAQWLAEYNEKANKDNWYKLLFAKRPYDVHKETCDKCRLFEAERYCEMHQELDR
jgi:hypothetical protein